MQRPLQINNPDWEVGRIDPKTVPFLICISFWQSRRTYYISININIEATVISNYQILY